MTLPSSDPRSTELPSPVEAQLRAQVEELQARNEQLQQAHAELQRVNQSLYVATRDLQVQPQRQTALQPTADTLAQLAAALGSLSEVLTQGIFHTDAQGYATYANAAFCQMAGIAPQDAMGFGWMQAVHPADQATVREEWHRCQETGSTGLVEFRLLHADGQTRQVLGRSAPLRDANGQLLGFVGSVEDISRQRMAEDDAAWSRHVLESSGDCPALLHADGSVWQLSEATRQSMGLSEEQSQGHFLHWWEASFQPHVQKALSRSLEGRIETFEAPAASASMPGLWWSVTLTLQPGSSARPPSLLAVARDITRLRQREELAQQFQRIGAQDLAELDAPQLDLSSTNELLRHALKEARDLYQRAPCGYHSLNPQAVFVNINDTELRWLGYRREEVVGIMNFNQVLSAQSRPQFALRMNELMSEGVIEDVEYLYQRRDGTCFPVLLSATIVRDAQGGFLRTQTTVFDITRRKAAEQALRESEQFMHRMANAAHGRLYYIDRDEVCRFVNQTYEEAWSRPTSHVLGRRLNEFVTARTYENLSPQLQRAWAGQVARFEYASDEPGHADRHHSVSLTPDIRDGEVVGIFLSAHEITELRRAERAAVDNLRFLRMITDNIPARIGYYDANSICRFANKAYEQIFGKSVEQIIGLPVQEVISERLYASIAPQIALALQGQVQQFETSHTGRNGLRHYAEVSFVPDRQNDRVVGVFASIHDITQRRRAEDALRVNQQFINMIADNIDVSIAYYDQQLICRYANRHHLRASWHDPSRVIGQHIRHNMPERAWAEAEPRLQAVLRGEAQLFEASHRDPAGAPHFVEVHYVPDQRDGEVVGFFARVEEITQRKLAETRIREANRDLEERIRERSAALYESEERFRLMTEGMRGAALFFLSPSGHVTSWPRSAERLYGHRSEEVWGWHYSAFMAGGEAPGTEPGQELRLALHQGQHEDRGWRLRRDGTQFWGLTVTNPLRDASGNLRGYSALVRDISEIKQAQQLMQELNSELEHRVQRRTEQLQAANHELESFSYSVSHDLRSPLRHIVGNIEILKDRMSFADDAESLRLFNNIQDSARRMGQLIDGLLTFARLGRAAIQNSPVALNALVASSRETIVSLNAARQIQWELPDLPVVRGDPVLLQAVWTNLLDNAVKYTRPRPQALVKVSYERTETGVHEFCVADNGVGFDPVHAPKLFGVFQRLHHLSDFEGTGIGLALVRRIVERHGGTVWAESQLGAGSRFYFTLPPDLHGESSAEGTAFQ